MVKQKVKLFGIALVARSPENSPIQYYAESEEEAIKLFLENNQDLTEDDLNIKVVREE